MASPVVLTQKGLSVCRNTLFEQESVKIGPVV